MGVTLAQSQMICHCICCAACRWIPVSYRSNTDAKLQWTTINDCNPGIYTICTSVRPHDVQYLMRDSLDR